MFEAWGDESGSNPGRDPGAYIMSAAIIEPAEAEQIRDAMLALRRRSERKVHWRSDSETRHDEVVKIIADLPVEAFVVVRLGPKEDRDERRRRKALEPFTIELSKLGCGRLTLESRGSAADSRDLQFVQMMRARRAIPEAIRLDHTPGPAEPLLWLADALCGAVMAARTGEPRWLNAIASSVTVHEVDERPQT